MSVYFVSLLVTLLVTARQSDHDSGCGAHMECTLLRLLGQRTQLNVLPLPSREQGLHPVQLHRDIPGDIGDGAVGACLRSLCLLDLSAQ